MILLRGRDRASCAALQPADVLSRQILYRLREQGFHDPHPGQADAVGIGNVFVHFFDEVFDEVAGILFFCLAGEVFH